MATWPTVSDAVSFMEAAGLTVSNTSLTNMKFDLALAAAIDAFETDTGFDPFIAAAADSTRYYSPDGTKIIDLRGGLVASPTSVTVSYDPGGGYNGTELTTSDYWMKPDGADGSTQPYTWIECAGVPRGLPRSIVIVGKFGYTPNATGPAEDARYAVLCKAAAIIAPQMRRELGNGVISWREGDTQRQYGAEGSIAAAIADWEAGYKPVVNRYKREVIV